VEWGLEDLCARLLPPGQERIAWAKMAAVLMAARFCEPSSELHIAEDWYRRTALCDLLQLGDEEVNKDRLYRGLDHLLAHKAALEAHPELSPEVGDGSNREGGISWGCLTPPLLHRRRDMPCPTITCSS
jgi:hypothetical protein